MEDCFLIDNLLMESLVDDWSDVIPIPQLECENPVVFINYSSECTLKFLFYQ